MKDKLNNTFSHFSKLQKTMRVHSNKMVNGLVDLCKLLPAGAIGVEIGSFAGESSAIFAMSGKVSKLYCVDPWFPDYYSNKQTVAAEASWDIVAKSCGQLVKCKGTSDDILAKFDGKVDFVYIDGNHDYEYVKRDIVSALKVLKGDGIVCGHDYLYKKSPGATKAIDELLGYPDVYFPDYSWVKYVSRVGVRD